MRLPWRRNVVADFQGGTLASDGGALLLDKTDAEIDLLGRFFHGYYNAYCYLPLYAFCGEHLLAAELRPSNIDASAGTTALLERLVDHIRGRGARPHPRQPPATT